MLRVHTLQKTGSIIKKKEYKRILIIILLLTNANTITIKATKLFYKSINNINNGAQLEYEDVIGLNADVLVI